MERKQILKANTVLSMSKNVKERVSDIAIDIQGKELFPEKVNLAKTTLASIKTLPV